MIEQIIPSVSTSYFILGTARDVVLSGATPFAYEDLYQSIIEKKKIDRSYRYFRSITRLQNEFPFAKCARTGKKVNVWCSNDYVGTMKMYQGFF
jgi:hypothetical protein